MFAKPVTILKTVCIAILLFLTLSCNFDIETSASQKIQGSWVFDHAMFPRIRGEVDIGLSRDNCGFRFEGEVCHLNCSFNKLMKGFNVCEGMTSGFDTKFVLLKDSLKIWNVKKQNWNAYLIKKLTKDSLILFYDELSYDIKYVRPQVLLAEKNEYDALAITKVIFCELGDCNGCDDEVFYLDRKGTFYYSNLEKNIQSGKLASTTADSLFANFRYLNLDKTALEYVGGGIRTSSNYAISFIKNGSVVKRIIDNQNVGPDELLIGYVPLVDKLRKINQRKEKIDAKIIELVDNEKKWFYKETFEPK